MKPTTTAFISLAASLLGLAAPAQAAWYYHGEGEPWIWAQESEDWIYFGDRAPLAWSNSGQTWIFNPLAQESFLVSKIFGGTGAYRLQMATEMPWVEYTFFPDSAASVFVRGSENSRPGTWSYVADDSTGEILILVSYADGEGNPCAASIHLSFETRLSGQGKIIAHGHTSGVHAIQVEDTFILKAQPYER
ncbi:MAG: hypothetical protein Q7P63_13375 [Verrucomicrobiota bacterium JB022]|nr:hypothetical protein [Verrucomicrobiota bacterium JB022]